MINKFGESVFGDEAETLIPPFTVVTLKSRKDDYIEVDVARDNKNFGFSMSTASS